MSQTAHTPGPWTASFPVIRDQKSLHILADCSPRDGAHASEEECRANARLIAAAPDLEEALEALLNIFLDGRSDDFDEKEERAYRLASAALAKVTAA